MKLRSLFLVACAVVVAIFGLRTAVDRSIVAALARILGTGVLHVAHSIVVGVDGQRAAATRRQHAERTWLIGAGVVSV